MATDNQFKSQLKRVNPFPGLIIDADIWRDAHEYHRNQQKLHVLAFHGFGILQGLEVVANNPPDLSVTIQPGFAIDPEGNMIIVPQSQRYRLQTKKTGVVYLIVQFREIPTEPFQPPNGGQATRILEAYRIQETDKFPAEPFLELARIDFTAESQIIRDAANPSVQGKNEIVLSYRKLLKTSPVERPPAVERRTERRVEAPAAPAPSPRDKIILGHAVIGNGSKDLHVAGLRNLKKEIESKYNFSLELRENISLDPDVNSADVLYLTGTGPFDLPPDKLTILTGFLQGGGTVFAEGCAQGTGDEGVRAGREFGLAVNRLAGQLKQRLGTIPRTHPLLSAVHVFAEVPAGAQLAIMLAPAEGRSPIYSGSDYGCAWQGGYLTTPLSREIIRNASEIGINMLVYSHGLKTSH